MLLMFLCSDYALSCCYFVIFNLLTETERQSPAQGRRCKIAHNLFWYS